MRKELSSTDDSQLIQLIQGLLFNLICDLHVMFANNAAVYD